MYNVSVIKDSPISTQPVVSPEKTQRRCGSRRDGKIFKEVHTMSMNKIKAMQLTHDERNARIKAILDIWETESIKNPNYYQSSDWIELRYE